MSPVIEVHVEDSGAHLYLWAILNLGFGLIQTRYSLVYDHLHNVVYADVTIVHYSRLTPWAPVGCRSVIDTLFGSDDLNKEYFYY